MSEELGNGAEKFYLQLDQFLGELEKTPGWQFLWDSLKQERENAIELNLHEEQLSRQYYQGYVRALDFMLNLPAKVREAAGEVRARQDEEERLEDVQTRVERQYEGGGEVV